MTVYLVIGAVLFSLIELNREKDDMKALLANLKNVSETAVDQIIIKTLKKLCNQSGLTMDECEATVDKEEVSNEMLHMVKNSKS